MGPERILHTAALSLIILVSWTTVHATRCEADKETCRRLDVLETEQREMKNTIKMYRMAMKDVKDVVDKLAQENQRLMTALNDLEVNSDPEDEEQMEEEAESRKKRGLDGNEVSASIFLKEPKSKSAIEGKSVVLPCVTSKKIIKCIWRSPSNQEVMPTKEDSKYQLQKAADGINSCSMKILQAESQDNGSWTCVPQLEDTEDSHEAVGMLTVTSRAVHQRWKKYHRHLQLMDAVLAGYNCKTSKRNSRWRCIKLFREQLTWDQASASCKDHEARLVQVVSHEDKLEIAAYLKENCSDCSAWIGGLKEGQENLSHSECELYYSAEYLRIVAGNGEIFCSSNTRDHYHVFYICEKAPSMREEAYKDWRRKRKENKKGARWKGW